MESAGRVCIINVSYPRILKETLNGHNHHSKC